MAKPAVNETESASFPSFNKLPLRLRQRIYELALCPVVNFCIGFDDIDEYGSDSDEGGYSNAGYEDLDDEPSDLYSHPFAVSTKFSCSTPSLFLVNKMVNLDATKMVSSVEELANSVITWAKLGSKIIESPSPAFLSLCEQSRFVFRSSAASLSFLSSLPHDTRASIRSVFITSNCLYADDDDDRNAWSKPSPQGSTPFAASLRNLPNLQQVGIYVPTTNFDFYCSNGPVEVCEMLRDGVIDIARLLLDDFVDERYIVEDNYYTSKVFDAEANLKNVTNEFIIVYENKPQDLLDYAVIGSKSWPVKSIFKLLRQ